MLLFLCYNAIRNQEFIMQAIYHTHIDELNIDFLNMLKKQFVYSKVNIVISDKDDADYLNSSEKK